MGIIQLAQDALTRQLYEGMTVRVVPRGMAFPLDLFGLGEIRYGKKIESVLPLFVPDNRYTLSEDAIYRMDRIVLDRVPEWIEVGGYVYISKRELHEVADVIDNVLVLGSTLLADQLTGQPVYHYSNPVKVEGAYSQGKHILNIDTIHYVVRGDVLAIASTATTTTAFREYRINDYRLVSISSEGIYQYQITLDRGIHRDLLDEEIIQIRAFLGYKSRLLNLPTNSSYFNEIQGPFLLDWQSIQFISGVDIDETQYIQRYDYSRTPIGPPIEIQKNTVILDAPIRANQFLFWDKVDGDMNYDGGIERFLALLDDDGKWWLKHTCAPQIQVPFTFAAGSMVVVEKAALSNNEWFRIDDSENAMLFEYQVDSTYVPTATAAASGFFIVHPNVAAIANNDWFSLTDGFGTIVYFEYRVDSTFNATTGYVVIDISSAAFAVDVAVPTTTAINNVAALKITASRIGTTVNLLNNEISIRGNQQFDICANLVAIGWIASDAAGLPSAVPPFYMSGGTDDLETIDITAVTTDVEVANLTSIAINRANLRDRADFAGIFNSFYIFSEVPGTAGNLPITSGISDPNFLINGMSGGSGGIRWNFEVLPDQDVLMRIRFFPNDWIDHYLTGGVPVHITAELQSTDLPVERIDILFKGSTSGEVRMGDWSIATPSVGSVTNEYVNRVLGDHTYAVNGLIIKPLFPSIKDIDAKLGVTSALNAGYIRV
jgi:hypothetical protein